MIDGNCLRKDWQEIAREKQRIPKGEWSVWLIMAGRGFGKTRTGAESIKKFVDSGQYKNIAIIGKNLIEARHIMVSGMSGIFSDQNYKNATYFPSKRTIEWETGALAYIIGGDNHESLRGLQFDLAWIDEFAKFRDPEKFWDQFSFTLRLGISPKCIITTTPRPLQILQDIAEDKDTILTKGSTFENEPNLSKFFLRRIKEKYEGTKLGNQELFGELSFEVENPLWRKNYIQYRTISLDDMKRIVIGVDPAVTSQQKSDETGIIVAGLGMDRNIYVIDDVSIRAHTSEWAKIVKHSYNKYHANVVVAETNNGGDLVESVLRGADEYIPFRSVRSVKGKVARAEPVSLLYEASKVFHFKQFKELESQMLSMSYQSEITKSPDRLDALVWAIHEIKNSSTSSGSHVEPRISVLN
jgi:predicted phage terminase large subunit-like protein